MNRYSVRVTKKKDRTVDELKVRIREIIGNYNIEDLYSVHIDMSDPLKLQVAIHISDSKTGIYFSLKRLPLSRAVFSYATYIVPKYRGRGYAQTALQIKEDIAKDIFNAEYLVASVNNTNQIEKHILSKYNWVSTGSNGITDIWIKRVEGIL